MKKLFLSILTILPLFACVSCGGESYQKVKEIDEYIFEVPVYNSLDYEYANNYFAESNDNWGGGCSSVSKIIDGQMVIGRNMDLNISNKCAYVIRTEIEGKYSTFGLSYTFRDISPDYADAKKHGISEKFYKVLPFMCDDVMNSEGLHIEINMRNAEFWPDGEDIFSYDHTNKEAKERYYIFQLCQYVALNCTNVEEAKEYVNSVDLYNKNGYWNYCFLISDASGNSSLLEPAMGEIFWVEQNEDMVNGQTNYYRNELCYSLQDIKSGIGRFATLMNDIDEVTNVSEMYQLMKKIQYSSFYLEYDDCKDNHFDPRSENLGTSWGAVSAIFLNDEVEPFIREKMNEYTADVRKLSRQEKQDKNEYWESSFTEVVIPSEKMIKIRFFEDESKLYEVTFSGIKKLTSID